MPLIGYAEAWSPSTPREIVGTPVMIGGRTPADVQAMTRSIARRDRPDAAAHRVHPRGSSAADVVRRARSGSAQPPQSGHAAERGGHPRHRPHAPRRRRRRDRPHERWRARHGVRAGPRSGRRRRSDDRARRRALQHDRAHARARHAGEAARQRAVALRDRRSRTATTSSPSCPAPIPQLKDEVVLLGAHLDSWHTGDRRVRQRRRRGRRARGDAHPEARSALSRDARFASRSGAARSRACSARRRTSSSTSRATPTRTARDRLFVYLNIDPGTGPIYGWYLEDTPSRRSRCSTPGWRRSAISGCGATSCRASANTDHLSFRAVGVPGFNADPGVRDLRRPHCTTPTSIPTSACANRT